VCLKLLNAAPCASLLVQEKHVERGNFSTLVDQAIPSSTIKSRYCLQYSKYVSKMDALAGQLARSIGNGPNSALRAELQGLFASQISTLILNLELCESPYRVMASTPNILDLTQNSQGVYNWQIILTQTDESTGWEPIIKPK
jgi:hypothetical protein